MPAKKAQEWAAAVLGDASEAEHRERQRANGTVPEDLVAVLQRADASPCAGISLARQ